MDYGEPSAIRIFLVITLLPWTVAAQLLDRAAYIGDSKTGAPGVPMIGKNLICLDPSKIFGYGNASSFTYLGRGGCRLFGFFQGGSGYLRQEAPHKFQSLLDMNKKNVDTVIVALGDNPSRSNFAELLKTIKSPGRECV